MQKPALIADSNAHPMGRANTKLYWFLVRLIRGESLTVDESAAFFRELTGRNANEAQIAAALTALAVKQETSEEIAGMLQGMAEQAISIDTRHKNFINISGTGASPARTFNVSTAAAFVAAGAGIPVAKHTGRGVTSTSGSADVLGELGIEVLTEPKVAAACLDGAGICFTFSPTFYPGLRRVKDIGSSLGFRTCLNILDAVASPANPPKQLIGVWHRSLLDPVAKALAIQETERAWVVHGADGLDELTLSGETFVAEVSGGKIREFTVVPEDFGLKRGEIRSLRAQTPGESAEIVRDVLSNRRRDVARSLVVLNAAAALLITGIAHDPMRAARMAEQSIDSQSAQTKLERLIQSTSNKSKKMY